MSGHPSSCCPCKRCEWSELRDEIEIGVHSGRYESDELYDIGNCRRKLGRLR